MSAPKSPYEDSRNNVAISAVEFVHARLLVKEKEYELGPEHPVTIAADREAEGKYPDLERVVNEMMVAAEIRSMVRDGLLEEVE